MHASVAEVVGDSNVWDITIKDVTRDESYTHDGALPLDPRDARSGSRRRRWRSATNAGFAALAEPD